MDMRKGYLITLDFGYDGGLILHDNIIYLNKDKAQEVLNSFSEQVCERDRFLQEVEIDEE